MHSQSLCRGADFRRAYRQGSSVAGKYVVVYAVRNGLSVVRAGYPVGKKYGGAVQRNRIKRLLREALRLCSQAPDAGYDLVIVPRRRMVTDKPSCQVVLADMEAVISALRISAAPVPEVATDDGQG